MNDAILEARSAAGSPNRGQYIWLRLEPETAQSGAQLADLRSGVNREPGDAPAMWPYYTTLRADGSVGNALRAEHVALTLFALHQRSKNTRVHRDGVGLGTALRHMKDSRDFSPEAVDRRFSAAATASSFPELARHLRGLVSQLRSVRSTRITLDYTQLFKDLTAWQNPDQTAGVRRRWGAQYFLTRQSTEDAATQASATEDPSSPA